LGSLGLSLVFGLWQSPAVSVFGAQSSLPPLLIARRPYELLCSADFQIFSVFCALSPAFASIALGFRKKLNSLRLLFLSTVPYLSLMIVVWRGILGYLMKGRVIFPPTGEQTTQLGKPGDQRTKASKHKQMNRLGTWQSPTKWEILSGSVLAVASLLSANFGMFAVSSCLLVGVGIEHLGWECRSVRIATLCCFAVILLHMIASIVFQTGTAGTTPLIFTVHF
jgi:hypothetical protein